MDQAATNDLQRKIAKLPGPVLVIGAGGFIGANLFRILAASRDDVLGTVHNHGSWRLDGLPSSRFLFANLLDHDSIAATVNRVAPAVVFDCSAYGAYSFETDVERIHRTNYLATVVLLEHLSRRSGAVYIHAGSSSEYGRNCAGPTEDALLSPDSHYAVSKAATAQAIAYYGPDPGPGLRQPALFYSAYGPLRGQFASDPGPFGTRPAWNDASLRRTEHLPRLPLRPGRSRGLRGRGPGRLAPGCPGSLLQHRHRHQDHHSGNGSPYPGTFRY